MEGVKWKELVNKEVFLKLKNSYTYRGIVEEISDTGDGLIWIHLRDKFEKIAVILTKEIVEFVEK